MLDVVSILSIKNDARTWILCCCGTTRYEKRKQFVFLTNYRRSLSPILAMTHDVGRADALDIMDSI